MSSQGQSGYVENCWFREGQSIFSPAFEVGHHLPRGNDTLDPSGGASYHATVVEREFVVPLDCNARLRVWHRMDFNQGRTFAQKDILTNWQEYRRIFLEE